MTARSIARAAVALALVTAPVAMADVGEGNPIGIGFGRHPVLRPVLHATVATDVPDDVLHYTAKGYFKVGTKTVARLPSFSGTANGTITPITFKVSTYARHTIRAIARNHNAKRTTLTIVMKIDLPNGQPRMTYTQDAFLTIPKN